MKKIIVCITMLIQGITLCAQRMIVPPASAIKPIALLYQVGKLSEPQGGWILEQTKNSLQVRTFHNNYDWEFTGSKADGFSIKKPATNIKIEKVAVTRATEAVTKPTAELLHVNAYVTVYAQGCIPTPAKIVTAYSGGANKGGSIRVLLPFSDKAKIIELSWNAMSAFWLCTSSTSDYITEGKKLYGLYLMDETNAEYMYNNSQ